MPILHTATRPAATPSPRHGDALRLTDDLPVGAAGHGPVLDVAQLADDELRMWMRTLGALLRRDATAPGLRSADDPVRRHRLTEELGRLATEARRRRVARALARR